MAREKEDSEARWREHRRRRGASGLFFGLVVFVLGLVWLGNDLNWWNLNIPWGPVIVVLLGIGMMFGAVLRLMH